MEEKTIELKLLVSRDSGLAYEIMVLQGIGKDIRRRQALIAYELMISTGGA